MKTQEIKKLTKLKIKLFCKLFESTNSKEEFISIRSQYYKVSYDLYLMKKRLKALNSARPQDGILSMPANNDNNLSLIA